MKIIKIIAVIMASVILCAASGCSKSCEKCNELIEIMNEISECREILDSPEYNGDNEGSAETEGVEDRLVTLREQYTELCNHECTSKVEKVKNKDYNWIDTATGGKYTGEWKGFAPCGSGTYQGENLYPLLHWDREGCTLEYTGDWEYGIPNGYGEYYFYQENMGRATINTFVAYNGEFADGSFEGQGTIVVPYGLNSYFGVAMVMSITSTFSGSRLTGDAEYYVYNDEGELYDHGYVNRDRKITQSDRADELARQNIEIQRQSEEIIFDFSKETLDRFIKDAFKTNEELLREYSDN